MYTLYNVADYTTVLITDDLRVSLSWILSLLDLRVDFLSGLQIVETVAEVLF
jgi:hypothetical protein